MRKVLIFTAALAAALALATPAQSVDLPRLTPPTQHGKPLPDLVVSAATSTGVTVSNIGDAPAGLIIVYIPGAHSCPGYLTNIFPTYNSAPQVRFVAGLAPGASSRIAFTTFSDWPRTIVVDPGNAIRERSELNNSAVAPGIRCAPTLG